MRILVLLVALLLCSSTNGQVNPLDYGAIPNDGKDDSAAFVAAYKKAIEANQEVRVPAGVFDLNPLIVYVTAPLSIVGEGCERTKFRRLVNRSWTQRFRCGKGATLRIEGIAVDGNANKLEPIDGDDQHHEIRIDQLGKTSMESVVLQSVGAQNLIADGVQFVHNGLQHVAVRDFRYLGGDKGRRNLQFSYHPKSAHVSDSFFRDFSTEPSGGTKNRMNLTLQDCTITGTCNLQECGDLRARRLSIQRLSSLTCDSGVAEKLSVATAGTIVGPSNITIIESTFAEPLKFWARFNRHKQNVKFVRCSFPAQADARSVFSTIHPSTGHAPSAEFAFIDCEFAAPLQLGNGYQHRVENCAFTGNVGIRISARFGPSGSLTEANNSWGKSSILLEQVTTGHPFTINLEPATLALLKGKGDYYPLDITEAQ